MILVQDNFWIGSLGDDENAIARQRPMMLLVMSPFMGKIDSTNIQPAAIALNAVCPYYTMFPIEYPLSILRPADKRRLRVLDPFCGRGTTIFAARLLGHEG
jgi:DNA modification methylase